MKRLEYIGGTDRATVIETQADGRELRTGPLKGWALRKAEATLAVEREIEALRVALVPPPPPPPARSSRRQYEPPQAPRSNALRALPVNSDAADRFHSGLSHPHERAWIRDFAAHPEI